MKCVGRYLSYKQGQRNAFRVLRVLRVLGFGGSYDLCESTVRVVLDAMRKHIAQSKQTTDKRQSFADDMRLSEASA
jgi:hypothetical protein